MEKLPAKFTLAKGLLKTVGDRKDKAVVIENTVGYEYIFTLISTGVAIADIASSLGLTLEEFGFISSSSPQLRKRFLAAKSYKLATKSMEVLEQPEIAEATSLTKEQKSALDYHSANIDRILRQTDSSEQSNNIIIQNTVVVRDKKDVPELPEELKEVIDVEAEAQ